MKFKKNFFWHVTGDTWQVTGDTWHMTCDMWHMTQGVGWINYKAVYRTAPAKPGLLKTVSILPIPHVYSDLAHPCQKKSENGLPPLPPCQKKSEIG